VNGPLDEESIGMSPAGDEIFLFFDNEIAYADVMSSRIKGKTWQRPLAMGAVYIPKVLKRALPFLPMD
jgi:hypothetical protein